VPVSCFSSSHLYTTFKLLNPSPTERATPGNMQQHGTNIFISLCGALNVGLWVCENTTVSHKARPALHYPVDLRIQTYTEPVPLKYGKLATKYPWIYGHFLQCSVITGTVEVIQAVIALLSTLMRDATINHT